MFEINASNPKPKLFKTLELKPNQRRNVKNWAKFGP